jgi:UDP-3-O-[3-hydroxymyristoyl] glucosamine N-acyltransferase
LATDPERAARAHTSKAAALVVRRALPEIALPQLICTDPARALAVLLELFRSPAVADFAPGVDVRAAIEHGAQVDPEAWIGPFTYVGPGAVVGPGACIEPFSYVGAGARVGRGCHVGPGATIARGCRLDDRVVLGPGSVVGFRGFGFWRDAEEWRPLPARAGVEIGADVEVGANSCVDGGTLEPTHIGAGAKIDNLVQIGHNAVIHCRALLCGQVGIAGSVTIGEGAVLGGQAGVADHLTVGRGARVAAHSGVAQDVVDGATVAGYPAFDRPRWLRASALLRRLAEIAREVRHLRRSVEELLDRGGPSGG